LDAVCVTANMARVRCTVPYPSIGMMNLSWISAPSLRALF
jgi:hypothetical protein